MLITQQAEAAKSILEQTVESIQANPIQAAISAAVGIVTFGVVGLGKDKKWWIAGLAAFGVSYLMWQVINLGRRIITDDEGDTLFTTDFGVNTFSNSLQEPNGAAWGWVIAITALLFLCVKSMAIGTFTKLIVVLGALVCIIFIFDLVMVWFGA